MTQVIYFNQVTQPTPGMLKAMIAAETGDDVFKEDPTINLFEETIAKLTGKESAIFCTSGTLSNQVIYTL